MGFAGEQIPENCREIAKGLFTVTHEYAQRGELAGLCPFHAERKPSFGYNYKKDVFHCQGCDVSGDLIDLYCHVNGLDRRTEGFKRFCQENGIETSKNGKGKGKAPAKTPIENDSPSPKLTPNIKKGNKPASEEPQESPFIPEEIWDSLPPLPDAWVDRMEVARGWTRAGIAAADLRLYTHTAARGKAQGLKLKVGQERIAIPVRDDQGVLRNVRLYLPGADPDKDGPKITSWGVGFGAGALLPAPSSWRPGPLWFCEGEPDYIAALSQGLNAVTKTIGAGVWKEEWVEHFQGREVIFPYDADKVGLGGAEKGALLLAPVAKLVRVILWPRFMFEDHSAEKWDGKTKFSAWVMERGEELPQNHGYDLTDFFKRFGKTVDDLRDLLASARTFERGQEEDPEGLLGPSRFFGGKNGRTFKPVLLAQAILQDLEIRTDPQTSKPYRWNGRHWEEYDVRFIRRKAIQYLESEATSSRAADATNIILDLSVAEHGRHFNDRPELICLKNGVLNMDTNELLPHDKELYSSYMLNVSYDPKAPAPIPERWIAFLKDTIQDPQTIRQVQEFFGLCLTRETRFAKCLLLLGPGSDGKSTCLDILMAMVGEENCAAVAMDDLEKEFCRASLHNKVLNVSAEFDGNAFTTSWFKKTITGDTISASFKHKDYFEFRPFAKHAFAANRFPRALDNSDGFFRRLLVVKFKKQFFGADRDMYLKEALLAELDGIFAWSLAGLSRLVQKGDFTESLDGAEALHEYKVVNNPVLVFKEERLVVKEGDKTARIPKAELYLQYKKFCDAWGFSPGSRIHFGRELKTVIPSLAEGKEVINGARENCHIGIAYSSNTVATPPPPPSGEAPPSNGKGAGGG